MRTVFGLIIYGVPSPFAQGNTTAAIYTNADLPSAGRPAELSGALVVPIVERLPGINWGADPRHPSGSDGTCTVTLSDDKLGTLGTIFLEDREAPFWGIESNRISDDAVTLTLVNEATPEDDVPYFLGNECVTVTLTAGPTFGYTRAMDLARAKCGSLAHAHVLRPSDYSAGEDGSQDRLYLRTKPDWSEGFLCGCYLFLLDELGAISDYILRRGVVTQEPTPTADQCYDVSIKFIEDRINSHTIGETSKETTLSFCTLVTKTTGGADDALPQEISVLLRHDEAELFFNEPVSPRGFASISEAYVADLDERIKADPDITYEIKYQNDATWVYRITNLSRYTFVSDGTFYQAVKVDCSLLEDGYQEGASCLTVYNDGTGLSFKPWYTNAISSTAQGAFYAANGWSTQGPAPVITLRCRIQKTMVQTFLNLAISRDGSSGDTYDKLIGGIGAGLPQSYFSLGSAAGSVLTILGNTISMLELDQYLNPVNEYYFDLSKGISLKDFLTNEFVLSLVLLGSLQSGLIALRSWIHEVPATITLEPLNEEVVPGKRLEAVKRLDLLYGTNVLTMEPSYHRTLRYLGTTTITDEETQPLRLWRAGSNVAHAPELLDFTDLQGLITAFYRVMGGAPRVYPVKISLDQYVTDGIEFGASVAWADPGIVTPSGLGIDDDFFVIGTDLDFDSGVVTLLLIQNTRLAASTDTATGNIAPTIKHVSAAAVSATVVDVGVARIDGVVFDPLLDFGTLYDTMRVNGSYLRVDNFAQAPLGELEPVGSLVGYCKITSITPGAPPVMRLTFEAAYNRSPITAAINFFVAGETRLNLPPRVSAEASLAGVLIEADEITLPASNNYVTFQPFRPLFGRTFTFGA